MKEKLLKIKKNRNLFRGLMMLAFILLLTIIGFVWTPYDPNAMSGAARNAAPSLSHIFGCDNFGRDIFSRIIAGLGTTVIVSALTVLIGLVIGTVAGALTGYYGGILDEILMRVNDALASFPAILLALVIISIFDAGKYAVIVALGLVFIPSFARVVRSEVIVKKNMDYVTNCKLMKASDLRIIFLHILPNTKEIVLSTVTIAFNNAILAEAGLSYLGLGVQPPDASLGRMLSEAQSNMLVAPWYAIFPGLTIIFLVLSIGLISHGLEDAGFARPASKKLLARLKKSEESGKNMKQTVSAENSCGDISTFSGDSAFLSVSNLTMGFADGDEYSEILHGISFEVNRGEVLGIVGESGSGKSVTAFSIAGLLAENAVVTGGNIVLDGHDLESLHPSERRRLLGKDISFIFQEPQTSFNPVYTIEEQLSEICADRETVKNALLSVGLDDTETILDSYPHELSGGMRQRVMIAMAMLIRPGLLIADEPTTALDASLQKVILGLIKKMNDDFGTTVILISHDLKVINAICGRTMVMKDGVIVESAETNRLIRNPQTEYTKNLMSAAKREFTLPETKKADNKTVIYCDDLNIYYEETSKKLFAKKTWKHVVKDIKNFRVYKGEILGIVGESGCGKTTLVKAICGLAEKMDGTLSIKNNKQPRMVFQDPFSSLNPAMKVGRLLEEPLRISYRGSRKLSAPERRERVVAMLTDVGLIDTEDILSRRVSELSGGQRQRVAIALALIKKSDIIVLDEPVSALDVTVQKQIIELLAKLREKHGITYLFISHDIDLVKRVCDRVIVMNDGRIVESGDAKKVIEEPENEYTKKLIGMNLSL